MTNTPTTLSGLELRKQVAMKLGYREEPCDDRYVGEYWLRDPQGEIVRDNVGAIEHQAKTEWLWDDACPAFESDLGALQASGVIQELVDSARIVSMELLYRDGADTYCAEAEIQYMRNTAQIEESINPCIALATAICRAFLSLPAETNA